MIYRAPLGFGNLDSARQSKIEASSARAPNEEDHSQIGKADEEDRFGKVAASSNFQNQTARGIKERGNSFLRFLDRYLGIPLIYLLGLCKKRKAALPESIHSAAFLITSGIGDLVLASAILRDLMAHFPTLRVTLFCGRSNFAMAELIQNVQRVPLSITRPLKAISTIRKESFDLFIDCNPWPRINALFCYFARASYKIGFRTKSQYRHFIYDFSPVHRDDVHEIENLRNLIRPLCPTPSELPHIPLSSPSEKKGVVLHLFAGGSRAHLKEWPSEKWIELINHLTAKNIPIILTGSTQDAKKLYALVHRCRRPETVAVVAEKLSLKETAEKLLSSQAVVTVDTGIMHLAAAVGAHVIALHGPTSSKRWGALSDKTIVVTCKQAYIPCIYLGFEKICKTNLCMQKITVSSVIEALESVL